LIFAVKKQGKLDQQSKELIAAFLPAGLLNYFDFRRYTCGSNFDAGRINYMIAGSGAGPAQVRYKSGISPGLLGKLRPVLLSTYCRNYKNQAHLLTAS